MWSDDINKKIIEGEEASHSHQTERAWNDMEALLDKHLPQEKKRRRFIFLLFPLLLGAGLATFYFMKTQEPGRSLTSRKSLPQQSISTPGSSTPESEGNKTQAHPKRSEIGEKKDVGVPLPQQNKSQSPNQGIADNNRDIDQTTPAKKPSIKSNQRGNLLSVRQRPVRLTRIANNQKQNTRTDNEKDNELPVAAEVPAAKNGERSIAAIPSRPVNEEATQKDLPVAVENKPAADSAANDIKETTKRVKKKGSFGDKFSLTFSVGPDISAVGFHNPGNVQLQYGIGAAYALTKNLTVRTGFYAGNKKYDADSSDYRMPYPINKLEKVEADCFVYEIPVSLVYNFNKVKSHNWFIGASVSSYIMKEETYGYYYKNTWNQPQYYDRTYKNENTHLFSVVGLSGGYQYRLSDRLSLLAEPYIKVPVSGIGVGKVKLDNTGVLFTISYKPFLKK